jgi:gamma-glutamyltranspeptidase/glutathione hydrolase
MNGPAGEVPILVHVAREGRSYAISGQGTAPAAATRARFAGLGLDLIPGDGLLAATVPAALDAWCTLLARFGTRSLADVLAPARGLASRGFPMYPFLRSVLGLLEKRFREEWPTSAALYLPLRPGGRAADESRARRLPGRASVDAERAAKGSREAKIRAARDASHRPRGGGADRAAPAAPVRDAKRRARTRGCVRAAGSRGVRGRGRGSGFQRATGTHRSEVRAGSQGPVFRSSCGCSRAFRSRTRARTPPTRCTG